MCIRDSVAVAQRGVGGVQFLRKRPGLAQFRLQRGDLLVSGCQLRFQLGNAGRQRRVFGGIRGGSIVRDSRVFGGVRGGCIVRNSRVFGGVRGGSLSLIHI